jgi:hypothetical protein
MLSVCFLSYTTLLDTDAEDVSPKERSCEVVVVVAVEEQCLFQCPWHWMIAIDLGTLSVLTNPRREPG